jgi:hypothetical protein
MKPHRRLPTPDILKRTYRPEELSKMKKIIRNATLGLLATLLLLPALAQGAPFPTLRNTNTAQDNEKAKTDLYTKFKTNSTGDPAAQKVAYDAGKEYLQKYPSETDPKNKEITEFIALFDGAMRPAQVLVKVYNEKNYPQAFQMGKQVLTAEPDNIKVLTALGIAGLFTAASGNNEFNADAMTYAKKAIQLIEAATPPPSDWKPYKSKDETLGWLNYSLATMSLRTMPGDAIGYLVKAATYEGAPKNDPIVYYYLAALYSQDFDKLRKDYTAKYEGKEATPESKAAFAQVSAATDLVIDAYARAIAYTDANPQMQQRFQQQKTDWMNKVTELYKSGHNNSDAGLKEMIAGIRTKPLPTRSTAAATTTPATTPATTTPATTTPKPQ